MLTSRGQLRSSPSEPSMQRSKASSASSLSHKSNATTSLRRTLRSNPLHESDDDDVSDPRPWETRGPLNLYGSSKDHLHHHQSQSIAHEGSPVGDLHLPLYEMETRRRTNVNPSSNGAYGEKESVMSMAPGLGMGTGEEKELMQDDGDSGKWGKGYGVGPGHGGRRGLPPRQKRIPGWVGRTAHRLGTADQTRGDSWSSTKNGSGRLFTPYYP
jgi:dolichyl-phosphate-mannose-protein mannosyltransferase